MSYIAGQNPKFVSLDGEDRNVSHWSVAAGFPDWRRQDMDWGAKHDRSGQRYLRELGRGEADTLARGLSPDMTKVLVIQTATSTCLRIPYTKPGPHVRGADGKPLMITVRWS